MKKIITIVACFAFAFLKVYSQTDAEKQENYKLLQAAIKTKDTSKLDDIFNFKLTPDYYQDNWKKPVIVMIADTKDFNFILSCLKAPLIKFRQFQLSKTFSQSFLTALRIESNAIWLVSNVASGTSLQFSASPSTVLMLESSSSSVPLYSE